MLRRALNKEKVPGELLDQAGELTQLRRRDLKKIIRHLHTEDPNNCHDMYKIFLKAAEEEFYHEKGEGCEGIARLRCLVGIDQVTAEELLSNTIPPGNIIHAIERLTKIPAFLTCVDASREYHEMTTALVAEMHRLCLPVNIQAGYGSSPVFTDNESQEKFWRRTGYDLHRYLENYNRLLTIPASDPHPKRNRKTFEAEFVDGNDPEIVAWRQRHPGILDEDYPEATGGYGRTTRGLLSERNMRHLIKCYFRSKPGLQTVEHRMLMQSIRAYKDGFLGRDGQMRLRAVLSSRLQLNRRANIYVKFLGLYRLPDIEDWSLGQTSRELEPAVFKTFFGKVVSSGLFQADVGSEGKRGPYYRKPAQYLASAMVLARYDIWDVKAGIEKLLEAKNSERLTDIVTKSIGYSRSISTIRSWAQATRTKPSHKRPPLSDIDWK